MPGWRCSSGRRGTPGNGVAPRDHGSYAARHLIENFFCKLKPFQGIAIRDDQTKRNSRAGSHRAAAEILLY